MDAGIRHGVCLRSTCFSVGATLKSPDRHTFLAPNLSCILKTWALKDLSYSILLWSFKRAFNTFSLYCGSQTLFSDSSL